MCLSQASKVNVLKGNVDGQRRCIGTCTAVLNDSPQVHYNPPGQLSFGVLANVNLEVTNLHKLLGRCVKVTKRFPCVGVVRINLPLDLNHSWLETSSSKGRFGVRVFGSGNKGRKGSSLAGVGGGLGNSDETVSRRSSACLHKLSN